MSFVSIAELAALVGTSRETVAKKVKGHPFHQDPDDRRAKLYDSELVLPIIYDLGKLNLAVDLNAAKTALAQKQVEKIDFEMEVKRGALLEYQPILEMMQRVFVAFRTRMLSIPTKAAPKVIGMSDPVDAQLMLEEFIHDALEEIADLAEYVKQYDTVAEPSGSQLEAPKEAVGQ